MAARTAEKRSHGLGSMHPEHLRELNAHLIKHIANRLWLQIIIGLVFGVIVGVVLGPSTGLVPEHTASIIGEWLALPGYFFLAVIQMVVVPLVFASVLKGITSSGDLAAMKRKGVLLVIYFLAIAILAIIIGIIVGKLLQPGSYIDPALLDASVNQSAITSNVTGEDTFNPQSLPQDIVSIVPSNPFGAILNSQMLQVVILSFIVGFALLSLKRSDAQPLLSLVDSVQSVSMQIVKWIMYIAPLAVFGLIAKVTINTGVGLFVGLAAYVGTVLFGLFVLLLAFLTIVTIIGGRNPITFLQQSKEALLMAFSTDSSAAVIPLSIKTAEDKMRISSETAQFVIPVGATVNMSGTALYQGLATMFMSQLFGLALPLTVLLGLIVTAVGSSIGTPAVPGVGIIILSSVLTSAGIPLAGIPLILGVDRILEMSRAALNVQGDLVACVVLERWIE